MKNLNIIYIINKRIIKKEIIFNINLYFRVYK